MPASSPPSCAGVFSKAALDPLPAGDAVRAVSDRTYFAIDYTAVLNLLFIAMTIGFIGWKWLASGLAGHGGGALSERILFGLALVAYGWLVAGLLLPVLII